MPRYGWALPSRHGAVSAGSPPRRSSEAAPARTPSAGSAPLQSRMSPRTHSPFRAARRLLPALALAAAALLAPGCKNDLDRVRAIEVPAGGPDRITTGAEY